MNKKLLIFPLISIQLIAILFLGYKIYTKKNVRGVQFVNSISKQEVNVTKTDQLNYFYEPIANTIDNFQPLWLPYSPQITINNDSLNDRYNYSIEKPENVYRIITLGDSFTYGLYVNTENNWTELLEDKLNNELECQDNRMFEVINLGMRGYDLSYIEERYNSRGQKYQPDLILYLLKDDDLTQIKDFYYKFEENEVEKLKQQGLYSEDIKDKIYTDIHEKAHLAFQKEYNSDEVLTFQLNNLIKLNSYKIPLAITTFTDIDEEILIKVKDHLSYDRNDHYFGSISDINSELYTFLPHDGHPNNEGHKIIATDTYNFLVQDVLKNCE